MLYPEYDNRMLVPTKSAYYEMDHPQKSVGFILGNTGICFPFSPATK